MILLDTDTLSISQRPRSPEAAELRARIAIVPKEEEVASTIISYEEQTRGWFTFLAKARTDVQRIDAYRRLQNHLMNWKTINSVPLDEVAYSKYLHLKSLRFRFGHSDLKIAAIALTHNALLVSRNLQDFKQIPNLRVEDWTRP